MALVWGTGTGKSSNLHKMALELCNEEKDEENSKICTVPFNPSTTYEDLFGEYIPQMVYGNLVQAEDNDCCEYVYRVERRRRSAPAQCRELWLRPGKFSLYQCKK